MWRRSSAYQSVEIGIDVPARHLAIFSGKSVTIEQDHYDSAIRAFADTMHQTHDNYTQATIAALNALQSASDRFWDGVRAAVPWVLLVVLVVGAIIYFNGAGNQGETSTSSGGSSYRRHTYDSWNSGGGGGSSSGGTGDDSGGGGGGASGNF